jgi:hypothetical protein
MLWHLAEIEVDFLALYGREVRIMDRDDRDTAGLSGPRFLNYAEHLPVFSGAVRNAAMRLNEQLGEEPESAAVLMLDPDLEVTRA